MNVYIGGTKDYSAMRGPCSEGFHIPTKDEWLSIYNIWTSLGGGSSDGTNFGISLKLSFSGARNWETGNRENQGEYCRQRCSTHGTNYADRGFGFGFGASLIFSIVEGYTSNGWSIRPFKDTPVKPTLSWTKLYGTSIESGGIFWNNSDGIISLSSDGKTWITISDKNLGATTVWNSGDTLSETNCGKYYQRGNNYGFAWTGAIAQSSAKVDTTGYGPGNYYSSSIFITGVSSSYDWSSVQNDNLRGGETGIVPAELKNAYIGEVWTPGSNTLGYYTFDDQNVSQITDFSGNNRNLTGGTMPSYTLVSGSNYVGNYANVSSGVGQKHEYGYMNGDYTMLIWVKPTSTGSCFINCLDTNAGNSSHQISLIYGYNNGQFEYYDDNAGSVKRVTIASGVTTNTWYLICYTRNGTSVKTYQNGNVSNTITGANTSRTKYLFMGSSRSGDRFKGVIGDCIIENRVRTAQEISHYYNLTKSNYGL